MIYDCYITQNINAGSIVTGYILNSQGVIVKYPSNFMLQPKAIVKQFLNQGKIIQYDTENSNEFFELESIISDKQLYELKK